MAMIDITKEGFLGEKGALTFDKLIEDATERGDVEALVWLDEQNKITQTRKATKGGVKGAGKEYTCGKSQLKIRNEYLEKFLGWKPKKETEAPQPSFPEKQAARKAAIEKAIAAASAAAVAAEKAKKK